MERSLFELAVFLEELKPITRLRDLPSELRQSCGRYCFNWTPQAWRTRDIVLHIKRNGHLAAIFGVTAMEISVARLLYKALGLRLAFVTFEEIETVRVSILRLTGKDRSRLVIAKQLLKTKFETKTD